MDRYEQLVAAAKEHIKEVSPADAAAKAKSAKAVIVDVREQDEWNEGHIPDAIHLSRGTLEFEIEDRVADPNAVIVLHCGGGGRSALAAESLQKMGYKNVLSMAGWLQSLESSGTTDDEVALVSD